MTIAELIKELEKFPQETPVVGQSGTGTWEIMAKELSLTNEGWCTNDGLLKRSIVLLLGYRH